MNKIGVSSGFYGKDWPVEFTGCIRKAAQLGFDAIELFTPGMLNQPKQKLKDYAKLAGRAGDRTAVLRGLTPDVDPASKDESVRRQGVEHLKKTLDLIGFLKGRIFGGVNYIAWGSRPEDIREKPAYRERSDHGASGRSSRSRRASGSPIAWSPPTVSSSSSSTRRPRATPSSRRWAARTSS